MRIAVVGSGIAGLGASWLLRNQAEVTLFEKQERLGGHSHTVDAVLPSTGETTAVDTGFIVYNVATYPNLIALFADLDVKTEASDMSFAVSLDRGAYEYAGDNLVKLMGNGRHLFAPSHWRLIADIVRFMKDSDRLCAAPENQTLGKFLQLNGYSGVFIDRHLVPMAAAIWSASARAILDFPARSFGHFFRNHGLLELDLTKRPQWRTVTGGSRSYVQRLMAAANPKCVLNSQIEKVTGHDTGARLTMRDGSKHEFDAVILASHADETMQLLDQNHTEQRQLLSHFEYSANTTYLHSDERCMPRRRSMWASWNYLRAGRSASDSVFVSYWMNRLQNIKGATEFFVTLNPPRPPDPSKTYRQMVYNHPQFDREALVSQKDFGAIQGRQNLWFCGSYFGYGFHEDALASAFAVGTSLGVPRPWPIEDVSPAFLNATARGI